MEAYLVALRCKQTRYDERSHAVSAREEGITKKTRKRSRIYKEEGSRKGRSWKWKLMMPKKIKKHGKSFPAFNGGEEILIAMKTHLWTGSASLWRSC